MNFSGFFLCLPAFIVFGFSFFPFLTMADDKRANLLQWLGKSRASARRVVAGYLKTVAEETRITDNEHLQTLAQHHPHRRFPSSAVFVLRRCPPFYKPALYVEAKTGGYIDFSWIRCIDNLYGAYSRVKVVRANTLSALRNEAFQSDSMQNTRADLGNTCEHCHKRCKKLVVDHAEKPFAQIVDEFLAQQGMEMEELKIRGSRNEGFRLRELGRAWRDFHDEHATLVGLCAKCNCSLGSRGYRHTKARSSQTHECCPP